MTFQITPAALTDLFSSINWSQTIMMTDPDALSGTQGLHPGQLHTDGLTGPPVGGAKEWELGNEGDHGVLQAGPECHVDMGASTFSLNAGLEFNINYSVLSGLSSLKIAVQGSATAHVAAKITTSAMVNYNTPTGKPWLSTQVATFWFTVGVVPVPITLDLEFAESVNVQLEGELELEAGTDVSLQIEEGAQYANGSWSAVDNKTFTNTPTPLAVTGANGTLALTYYPLSATFSLKPFDTAGPTLEIDPYLGVSGTYGTDGGEIDGALGVELEVGGEVEILHHNLGSFAYPLADISKDFTLWKSGEDAGVDGGWDAFTNFGDAASEGSADDGSSESGSSDDSGKGDDSGSGDDDSGKGDDSGSGDDDSGNSDDSGSGDDDSGHGTSDDSGSGDDSGTDGGA